MFDDIPLTAKVQKAVNYFSDRFGRKPRWLACAPGRVNLIGEHTDYNDGFVLPMAIDRYVIVAADFSSTQDNQCTVLSSQFEQSTLLTLIPPFVPKPGHWSSYVQGVIAGCHEINIQPPPFEAVLLSDVPVGGGLSSSAALEVATATLLEAMTGKKLESLQKALLCQKAEHVFAGMPCGIMDQCSSIFGREGQLMLLDCRTRQIEYSPLMDPEIVALIVNSNVKHELTKSEYALRRQQCAKAAEVLAVSSLRDVALDHLQNKKSNLDEVCFRRARHVVTENARVLETAKALKREDWQAVGKFMFASHESLRDDYEVSCPELDLLVELARSRESDGGVIGSRMTGGGFGGCTISLVRRDKLEGLTHFIKQEYTRKTGIEPTIFVTRPAGGARSFCYT